MEKHLDSMVMVARGATRNVRIVRMYPLTVLFTFTMVIIINSILGLIKERSLLDSTELYIRLHPLPILWIFRPAPSGLHHQNRERFEEPLGHVPREYGLKSACYHNNLPQYYLFCVHTSPMCADCNNGRYTSKRCIPLQK